MDALANIDGVFPGHSITGVRMVLIFNSLLCWTILLGPVQKESQLVLLILLVLIPTNFSYYLKGFGVTIDPKHVKQPDTHPHPPSSPRYSSKILVLDIQASHMAVTISDWGKPVSFHSDEGGKSGRLIFIEPLLYGHFY